MAGLLVRGLREDGHAVDVARTGDDALWMGQAVEYDAVVLDLMLPGLDGVSVCRAWRENGVRTPVLILTARAGVEDRVAGLDAGADDYLPKPFSFAELNTRLRALARRGVSERPAVVEVGDLRLDPATRQVWRGAVHIQLSTKEFALLHTLMRRAGLVLSRLQLLEHRVGLRLREPLERRGCLHPVPPGEGRSTVRPGVDRDRPRGWIPATEGRLGRESLADSGAAHARLRRRHDGCAHGARGVSLPAARRDARRARERAAAARSDRWSRLRREVRRVSRIFDSLATRTVWRR